MPEPALGPDTKFKLTIATAIVGFVAAVGFGWKAQGTLSAISASLSEVSARVSQVEQAVNSKISGLEIVMQDRWTKSSAAEWSLRLVVANPNLRIPDPRDPSKFLNDTIKGELRGEPVSDLAIGAFR